MSLRCNLFVLINVAISSFAQNDVCKEGFYGDNCELTCSETCRPFQTFPCDKKSGQCSEGCKVGYFGDQCDKQCDCGSRVCYQANGECIESDETTASSTKHKSDNVGSTTEVPAYIPVCDPGISTVWRVVGILLIVFTIVLFGIGIIVCVRRRMKKSTVEASATSHRRFPGITFCFPCFGARDNEEKREQETALTDSNVQSSTVDIDLEAGGQSENLNQSDQSDDCTVRKQTGKGKERKSPTKQTQNEEELKMKIYELTEQVAKQTTENQDLTRRNEELVQQQSEDERKLTRRIDELEQQHNKTLKNLGLPTDSKFIWRFTKISDPSDWFHCPDLKFDKEMVNVNVAHIDDKMILWNIPHPGNPAENSYRFQHFYGTRCTEPIIKTGFNQYFEAAFNITLKQSIAKGEIVMQLGFCGENDQDVNQLTKGKENSFVVRAQAKDKKKISLVSVNKDNKTINIQDLMDNSVESKCEVVIGIRFDKEFKQFTVYFKVQKVVEKTDNIIGETIWPMFGLCDQTKAVASVKLKTGHDIEMTKDKKERIRPKK